MQPRRALPRRQRRGVTMIEIAIVLAIIAIMAGMAAGSLMPLLPSWRTREAANEFASAIGLARQRAMAEGVQYRVRVEATDEEAGTDTPSIGGWSIAAANPADSAAAWDVLPLEDGGVDDIQGDGMRIISKGVDDALPGVSILPLAEPVPTDNALIFDSRGFLANGIDELNTNGTIAVVFINKPAALEGKPDDWTVCISRSGMVRASSSRNPTCSGVFGTSTTSNMASTEATGFAGDGSSAFGSPDL